MEIVSRGNVDDSVNSEYVGRVIYRIITIPWLHNFHIKETKLNILFHILFSNDIPLKKKTVRYYIRIHVNGSRYVM